MLATLTNARWPMLGLLLCALGIAPLLVTAQCAPARDAGLPPAVAWTGEGFAVAWAARDGASHELYYAHFERDGKRPKVRTLGRWSALRQIELAASGDRLTLIVRTQEALHAVRLSREGVVRGEPRRLGQKVTAQCGPPVMVGEDVWIAWSEPHAEGDRVYLGRLSPAATHVSSVAPADLAIAQGALARECALAGLPGGVSLAVRFTHRGSAEVELFDFFPDGPDREPIQISRGGDIAPVRLAAHGETRAVFLRHPAEPMALWIGTNHGGRSNSLDPDIASATADFVWEPAGFASAWTTSEGLQLRAYDSAGREIDRYGVPPHSPPSAVRMTAAGEGCAAAWTEMGGNVVRLVMARRCIPTGAAAMDLDTHWARP